MVNCGVMLWPNIPALMAKMALLTAEPPLAYPTAAFDAALASRVMKSWMRSGSDAPDAWRGTDAMCSAPSDEEM